jgi:predicted metal-dependent hydrolase
MSLRVCWNQKSFIGRDISSTPLSFAKNNEKVNVSRAKRIPTKSYQNLASHTEDWLHKSIVDFKPRRILNEELDLLYDVYENQVTIALIERCLIYLNSRIQEVHDISNFLTEYNKNYYQTETTLMDGTKK